jgi:hypothetical protein
VAAEVEWAGREGRDTAPVAKGQGSVWEVVEPVAVAQVAEERGAVALVPVVPAYGNPAAQVGVVAEEQGVVVEASVVEVEPAAEVVAPERVELVAEEQGVVVEASVVEVEPAAERVELVVPEQVVVVAAEAGQDTGGVAERQVAPRVPRQENG